MNGQKFNGHVFCTQGAPSAQPAAHVRIARFRVIGRLEKKIARLRLQPGEK